ncbi:uncharacterized protein DSM5745_06732 [Aspergillus mulundensis]|uniref:Uncharacterized protein n=1 Tax=Aspergillus mulundensis TaxID=1810919 RepID=A0A3D8RRZ9_9EURO|nr:hypothetical protein DSM5745_06732 [Aspergillus mulundensis]RDW76740.1 hypothetical protein DSM5745_06732 [Aspergillus mulundensis]
MAISQSTGDAVINIEPLPKYPESCHTLPPPYKLEEHQPSISETRSQAPTYAPVEASVNATQSTARTRPPRQSASQRNDACCFCCDSFVECLAISLWCFAGLVLCPILSGAKIVLFVGDFILSLPDACLFVFGS